MKTAGKWLALGWGCVWLGLAAGCDSDSQATSDVSVSPASVFLSADAVSVVTFTASGGDSNYTWSVSAVALGEIFGANETALYQNATNAGVNTLTVTDGEGGFATAVITQE
ncbi:MAG: hypothetical protein AB7V14_08325 [Kiritimatiellia bacterium]